MDKPIPEAVRMSEEQVFAEERAFRAWSVSPQGTAYDGAFAFARAAWMCRAQQQGQAVAEVCEDASGRKYLHLIPCIAAENIPVGTKLYPQPMQQGGGDGLGEGGRYWRERAEFWRVQAVALGWREKRDAENGEAAPPSAPVGVEGGAVRERVRDAVADALHGTYDCTRVWGAWSVGTMSQDDFHLVRDDESRLLEIADAAIAALAQQPAAVDEAMVMVQKHDALILANFATTHGGAMEQLAARRITSLASQHQEPTT